GDGGIQNVTGMMTIINTTISGNRSIGQPGGGIRNLDGMLMITSSTVINNSGRPLVGVAGGINTSDSGVTSIPNTIVPGNNGFSPDVAGPLDSPGHNLIGVGDGGSGFAHTHLVGTAALPPA